MHIFGCFYKATLNHTHWILWGFIYLGETSRKKNIVVRKTKRGAGTLLI